MLHLDGIKVQTKHTEILTKKMKASELMGTKSLRAQKFEDFSTEAASIT